MPAKKRNTKTVLRSIRFEEWEDREAQRLADMREVSFSYIIRLSLRSLLQGVDSLFRPMEDHGDGQ